MKLAGKTDVGRVRQENQDDYRAGELPGGAVWALVCDGMGGAKGGREASQGACNVIENVFQEQYAQCGAGQEEAFLKKALIYANRFVFQKASHEEVAGRDGHHGGLRTGARRHGLPLPCRRLPRLPLPGRGSLPSSPTTTPTCRSWWTAAPSPRRKPSITPRRTSSPKRWAWITGWSRSSPPQSSSGKTGLLLCTDGLTNMVPVEEMEELLAQGTFYDTARPPDRGSQRPRRLGQHHGAAAGRGADGGGAWII